MNIAIIGLGSMGNRRIRLIKKHSPEFKLFGVDISDARRKQSEVNQSIVTHESIDDLLQSHTIHAAFVCTSPLSHGTIISELLKKGIHVFSELNLVLDDYDQNIALAKELNLLLFMSSTLLYRDEIKRINSYVQTATGRVNYIYHVGQYLPDWHPWENYKDFFVGDKKTNGCREILAIELPWITDVFGNITGFESSKDKISNLDLEYNDSYLLILHHKTGHKGMLAVDVVSRKASRNLEVFGQDLYLTWDGTATGLIEYDYKTKTDKKIMFNTEIEQLREYSNLIVENAYSEEIEDFFKSIEGKTTPKYTFENDKKILQLIDRIEAN